MLPGTNSPAPVQVVLLLLPLWGWGTGSPGQPGVTVPDAPLAPDPAEQALCPRAPSLERSTLTHPAVCTSGRSILAQEKTVLYKETPFIEKKETKEPSRRHRWELLSQPVSSEKQMGPAANQRRCHRSSLKCCICPCSARPQSLAPLHAVAQE